MIYRANKILSDATNNTSSKQPVFYERLLADIMQRHTRTLTLFNLKSMSYHMLLHYIDEGLNESIIRVWNTNYSELKYLSKCATAAIYSCHICVGERGVHDIVVQYSYDSENESYNILSMLESTRMLVTNFNVE